MVEITLYTQEREPVSTVTVPTVEESGMQIAPEIIKYHGRYFAYQEETGMYLEGQLYEVPS